MDKSWMSCPKYKPEYIRGIQSFIEFASHSLDSRGMMLCPCRFCSNRSFRTPNEVRNHLIAKGMYPGYVVWNRHGEQRHSVRETVNTNEARVSEEIPTIQANLFGVDNMEGLFRDTIDPSNVQADIEGCDLEGETSVSSDLPHTPHPEIHAKDEVLQETRHQQSQDEGIWLIDSEGAIVRRMGRTTCQDIQNLPPGIRVNIELNDYGVPCNIPESTLLGSYLGVVARDSTLAPISFANWRNPGMKSFKKRMLDDIEEKFAYPLHIRPWIRSSLAVKWRNHKTGLKATHWDGRPIQEIIEKIPERVDAVQWAGLVTRWNEHRDKERATQNTLNAQKQKCPHTMGRMSSVQRQQETSTQDRLQLWKINRIHKDGTWLSDDARQKWEILATSNLTPDDGNTEANERVFKDVMGPEHPGRVRCKEFGVIPSMFFSQSSASTGESRTGGSKHVSNVERFARIESDMREIKATMSQLLVFMKKYVKRSKKY